MRTPLLLTAWSVALAALGADPPIPPVPDRQPPPVPSNPAVFPRMLVPGFEVRELPVALPSLNNIEYAEDGRLFAGGYDGRFHLLTDSDGDGLEDRVDTFWPEPGPNYPLGLVVKDGEPHAVLTDEIVRFRDTDGDGVPDRRETVIKGFDDPELVAAPYLNHRRVDSSLALAYGPDGAWYLTMGNAGYNNPYWHDGWAKGQSPSGTARYSPDRRRGCLLRIGPDGRVEQLASGLRYIMSLQFNRDGDLFGTEQEGATWVPNGNPFDELLHLQEGRHYGFPPRHPVHLPGVVDEPSVWDYRPQHQSTCGFRFNTPRAGRGRFGPAFWEDDALVTGEARGKLWRTKLAKTEAGYVASTQLIADIGLLAVDCAVSPRGELVVCCHTGRPDWGNGPSGAGRIFQIRHVEPEAPQPVAAWAASETETVVCFDRPLAGAPPRVISLRGGRSLDAGSHLETMRPGYRVVQWQQRQPIQDLAVSALRRSADGREVTLTTEPRTADLTYALRLQGDGGLGEIALEHGLHGLQAEWSGADGGAWRGWLPHPDLGAAAELLEGSAAHRTLRGHLETPGRLVLRTRLNLFNLLQPPTQPGSSLGYEPRPESVVITVAADAELDLASDGGTVDRVGPRESRITFEAVREGIWPELTLAVRTPVRRLSFRYTADRDPDRARVPGVRRFLLPFARPAEDRPVERSDPELTGGNWKRGEALFRGKAACFTCHQLRGEGVAVGPDLNNLVHRDYASVLRDVIDPSAVINPDAVGYVVTRKNQEVVAGVRVGESRDDLSLAQPGGQVSKIQKSEVLRIEPMTVSLMPKGLDLALSKEELRDLMTYLLTEPAAE